MYSYIIIYFFANIFLLGSIFPVILPSPKLIMNDLLEVKSRTMSTVSPSSHETENDQKDECK